jgi:hypothetical protein
MMPPGPESGGERPLQLDPPAPPATGTLGVAPEQGDPGIDLEACELDALEVFLWGNRDALAAIADRLPKRIGPKARRDPERLSWAILEAWALPDCRSRLATEMGTTKVRSRLSREGLDAVPAMAGLLPPNALLWHAHAAGLDPAAALARLNEREQSRFRERQTGLQYLVAHLRERRQERQAIGEDARVRAARKEAERLTRQLRWRADRAEQKEKRAAERVRAVARDREGTIRRLEKALTEARGRVVALEQEVGEWRAAFATLAQEQRALTAALAREQRAKQGAKAGKALPLTGERVLVIGDEGRRAEYARIVEELGGEFAFYPGFQEGPRLDGALASATVAAFVASYASHKTLDHVREAERAGLAVVLVPVAGAGSFRRALRDWHAGRHAAAAEAER